MKNIPIVILSIISISTLTLAIINCNKVQNQSDLISAQSDLISDLRAELEEPNFESLFAKNIQTESITVLDEKSLPRVVINAVNDPQIVLKDADGVTRVAISQTDDINSIQLASSNKTKSYITIGELESDWAPMFYAGWMQSKEEYGWQGEWSSGPFLSLADDLNHIAFQTWADSSSSTAYLQIGNLDSYFSVTAYDENCYFGIDTDGGEMSPILLKYENSLSSFEALSTAPYNTRTLLGNMSGVHSLQLVNPEMDPSQRNAVFLGYGMGELPNEASLIVQKDGDMTTNFNMTIDSE